MSTSSPAQPVVCVVLHDVAAATWPACETLIEWMQIAAAGRPLRFTLLVVPCLHGAPAPAWFVHELRQMQQQGHELVLHGWLHRDEQPVHGWRERLKRRWYTAGEGEFAALDAAGAAARLQRGLAWMATRGLRVAGFVAPAWLMSRGTWAALQSTPLSYTCTLRELVALPQRQRWRLWAQVFSARSGWRRVLSVLWTALLAGLQRQAPVLRLELHPADAGYPMLGRAWVRRLDAALGERRAATLGEAVAWLAAADGPTPAITGLPPASSARSTSAVDVISRARCS